MNYGWWIAGALMISTPAFAELPEGNLRGQWSTVRFLVEGGRSEGISESGLVLIREIYTRAKKELTDEFSRNILDLCARPQRLRDGGQEGLIKFLEQQDKRQDDVELQALERIYENLSAEDREVLDTLIEDNRRSSTVIAPGPVAYARTGELTVEQVIERSCRPEVLEQLKSLKSR